MTILARDADTGMAKWVYQMTPHDEWDYDGVNEMILVDQKIGGTPRKLLIHFDRNGFGYTLDRANGELLVAEKYDPAVNWTTRVDMNKNSPTYGRPLSLDKYSTDKQGEDDNIKGICPAALGTKDEQPAAYSPDTGLFYVPTNHVCMDYEPFKVSYTAGQPYVGATLSMYPPPGETNMGNFIAWDARTGKIVWSKKEQFSVWSGALATAGDVVFYGTLEGYLKAVDAKTGKELYKFKTSARGAATPPTRMRPARRRRGRARCPPLPDQRRRPPTSRRRTRSSGQFRRRRPRTVPRHRRRRARLRLLRRHHPSTRRHRPRSHRLRSHKLRSVPPQPLRLPLWARAAPFPPPPVVATPSPTPGAVGVPAPSVEPPAGGVPLLTCRGVHVAYDKVPVLFGVDMEVRHGEIVTLLGTNGAGKSTLLKAVSGLVDPTAGSIVFDGRDITHATPGERAGLGIVQVPGGRAVFPTLTVAEHFKAAAWLFAKEDAAEVRTRTTRVLELFPRLSERWHQMAGNLSGGEQQQLGLGMAFVAKPRLLIIDELSLGLAPAVVEQLLEIVREIHAEGCPVILVEQSVNVALTIAQRAYFMEKGEVRFEGAAADLLTRGDLLRSVFLEGAGANKPTGSGAVGNGAVVTATPGTGTPGTGTLGIGNPARGAVSPAVHGNGPAPIEGGTEPWASQPVVLSARGLTKRFGGIVAVDDVAFELRQGETLGLIGPNGAGKTTILDLISGALPLDGGRVELAGADIGTWSASRRAAAGLGRSFQDARIFSSLTVAENIAMGLERHVGTRDHLAALAGPARHPTVRARRGRAGAGADRAHEPPGVSGQVRVRALDRCATHRRPDDGHRPSSDGAAPRRAVIRRGTARDRGDGTALEGHATSHAVFDRHHRARHAAHQRGVRRDRRP